MATVSLGSTLEPFFWIRETDTAASSSRPALTKNQGDSGAKWIRMIRGMGQTVSSAPEGRVCEVRLTPLSGHGDFPCPIVCSTSQRFENTSSDELTNDPAEVNIGGEVPS